jgi:hypothetical protein
MKNVSSINFRLLKIMAEIVAEAASQRPATHTRHAVPRRFSRTKARRSDSERIRLPVEQHRRQIDPHWIDVCAKSFLFSRKS